jgi:hypothetical protein
VLSGRSTPEIQIISAFETPQRKIAASPLRTLDGVAVKDWISGDPGGKRFCVTDPLSIATPTSEPPGQAIATNNSKNKSCKTRGNSFMTFTSKD